MELLPPQVNQSDQYDPNTGEVLGSRNRPPTFSRWFPVVLSVVAWGALIVMGVQIYRLRKQIDDMQYSWKLDLMLAETRISNKLPFRKEAAIDLNSTGYSRVDTDSGTFFVSVHNAVPYLDGYKVELSIGNPSSATFTDARLKARWGRAYDPNDPNTQQWEAALHSREYPISSHLMAGRWTNFEIVLPSTRPEETAYVEVSLQTPKVILY